MLDEPRRRRRAPDLETNTEPDLLHDDLRRRDQRETPPDSMPSDEERKSEEPAGRGFTPKADGGNDQHPIHDEEQEDASPSDYEREIERLDAAIRGRAR